MGSSSNYNLVDVDYDKMGNITALERRGHTDSGATSFGVMDNLVYTYDSGNKLKKVLDNGNDTYGFKDGANTTTEYTYDVNGNMVSDANKGISDIDYNHLNLPTKVTITGSNAGTIDYVYDATGGKLKKVVSSGNVIEYAGGFVYENNVLQFFPHEEGYVAPDGSGGYDYVYQFRDYLGNVRLSYADSDNNGSIDPSTEIISEKNYYPFGLEHKGYNSAVSPNVNGVADKWRYNGTEFEESLGLDLYEMEFRNYDPAIAKFTSIDPVTHHSMSPYVAFDNNPVFWSDPSGADSIYNWNTGQYVINGQVVSQDEAIAYAKAGGNADGSNNNTPDDGQSTQPKYQFFGISPTGEQMNLNFDNENFNILTGYGDDPSDIRKAKLGAFKNLFKALKTKDQVKILRFLKIPSKHWVGILGKAGKVGPAAIMPAYNVHDEGLAALPFGLGAVFQPLNDDYHSGTRQIENMLMWDDVLTGFNEMMDTEVLNDVIIIYSNENLFKQSTINTNEAENLSSRHATGNYKYAYYGTQFGNDLHIFGMYLINND